MILFPILPASKYGGELVKFFDRSKGAVSIFLVIILVPMMTVSALFVDASKVKLTKGLAESAGNLALNTALTDYDTVLKDMYGLFATAQDTDELYEKLEDYYRTSITSAGIQGKDADSQLEKIMSSLKGLNNEDSTSDIINAQLADFTAEKLDEGNLANATVLKKEMVDFMKYRAPINTGLSFLESLKSFVNLSKQTNLADKRKDYYEKQQTLMEHAKSAWDNINEYNKSGFISDDNYFTKMKTNLSSYKNQYSSIHSKTIKDLYNTEGHGVFNGYILDFGTQDNVSFNGKTETVITLTIGSNGKKEKNYTELTDFSASKKANANDLKTAISNCHAAKNEVYTSMEGFPESDSNTYNLQYIVQIHRAGKYERSLVPAVKKYYNCAQKMILAYEFATDEAKNSTGKIVQEYGDISYDSAYQKALSEFDVFSGTFNGFHSSLKSKLQRMANAIGNKTDSSGTNTQIQNIYNEICSYRTTLDNAKTNLTNAKNHLSEVYKMLGDDGELTKAKAEWSAAANDSSLKNDSMAKQDRAEIKDLGNQFNIDDVEKLINRCEKIIIGLESQINEIDKYTYAGTKLTEISDYKTLEYIVGKKFTQNALEHITTNETELNKKISQWWNGVYTSGNVDISWTTKEDSRVNFRYQPKLKFYTYLFTHFHISVFATDPGSAPETVNETAKEKDEVKNTYESTKSGLSDGASSNADTSATISPSNDITKFDDGYKSKLPSKSSESATPSSSVQTDNSSATENSSKSLSSMFDQLSEKLLNLGIKLRDNLYVSDYIMGMFSYDTFEKEAKYNSLSNSSKSDYISVKSAPMPEDAKLTNLRNQPIDSDHNYMYGGEVEYIIYGGNDTTNKLAAYGSIFAIRLGFNLVYAFTNSEIREGALAIAVPISAATLGIIPAPLIQAAIIIGISIGESAIDLMCLREGMGVPLFKNKNTWNLSFENLVSKLGKAAKDLVVPVANKVIDAGTEYLESWLDKTDEELKNMTTNELDNLGNSVEASFTSMIEREADIVIQKVTTLVENSIEEGVTTADEAVKYVSSRLDDWLSKTNEDKNSLAYTVKNKAVAALKSTGGNYIKQIFNGIKESSKAASTEAINAFKNVLDGIRKNIRSSVSNAISGTLDKVTNEVKNAAKKGASKLKDTINSKVDSMFGSKSDNIENGGISSLLTFQYSSYLKLFLLIGLFTNPKGIIKRTADVIQVNMGFKLTDNKDYRLKESAVYVKVDATIVVKPTLLGLPIFTKVKNNPKDNTKWYTVEYSGIKGY